MVDILLVVSQIGQLPMRGTQPPCRSSVVRTTHLGHKSDLIIPRGCHDGGYFVSSQSNRSGIYQYMVHSHLVTHQLRE